MILHLNYLSIESMFYFTYMHPSIAFESACGNFVYLFIAISDNLCGQL